MFVRITNGCLRTCSRSGSSGKGILKGTSKHVFLTNRHLSSCIVGGYRSVLTAEIAQRMGYEKVCSLEGGLSCHGRGPLAYETPRSAFMKWPRDSFRKSLPGVKFVKISHTLFALPFALAAMLVAAREQRGWPGWRVFLLILAMVTARTCAMTFNRIVDRQFDRLNPRTANRHLVTGAISLWSARLLGVLSAAGFIASAYGINGICFALLPVALFVICFYSLTKRFTDYTRFLEAWPWLGTARRLACGSGRAYLVACVLEFGGRLLADWVRYHLCA